MIAHTTLDSFSSAPNTPGMSTFTYTPLTGTMEGMQGTQYSCDMWRGGGGEGGKTGKRYGCSLHQPGSDRLQDWNDNNSTATRTGLTNQPRAVPGLLLGSPAHTYQLEKPGIPG